MTIFLKSYFAGNICSASYRILVFAKDCLLEYCRAEGFSAVLIIGFAKLLEKLTLHST
jgi:hypothetical protein